MKKIFQIHRHEFPLFFPLFGTLTLLMLNTKLLKILKDTLVVTTPEVGAELLPFLKTWALIPLSIVLISLLTRLQRSLPPTKVYILTNLFFLIFFGGYVFVIYPLGDALNFTAFIDQAETIIPQSFRGFLLMVEYWPLSLFYVMSEMWHIMMVTLLFWSFANHAIKHEQAKRFFPLFSIDLAGIVVGLLMAVVFQGSRLFHWSSAALWDKQLKILTSVLLVVGVLQMFLFLKLLRASEWGESPHPPKVKRKPPLKELIHYARSPFFGPLALVVFLFEFCDTFFEILWKDTLGIYLPDPGDFSNYLGRLTLAVGIIATLISLLVSRKLLQRHSWFRVAAIPPLLLMTFSVVFFVCFFFPSLASTLGAPFGADALSVTVFVGAMQSCWMQVSKCTLFDNTKDLAFMVCKPEERVPARGFSDALATRMGKSTSCLTQQGILMATITLNAAAPYIAGLIGLSVSLWLLGLKAVSHHYGERSNSPP